MYILEFVIILVMTKLHNFKIEKTKIHWYLNNIYNKLIQTLIF